ncbi:MAG TPA: HEAT repeat domain-containing protein [Terriglobia bacterium]|nr:HEAT repeat domain-containing protein [Terriglobia bacterium]
MVELERGSTDTKLWKEVKRKRVRIPDLVCTACGQRVESRAKTKPELSMSHSVTDQERAWDFGMVDSDYIGFPVCEAVDEKYWSAGRLQGGNSYWHERNWVRWQLKGQVNYFRVSTFRRSKHTKISTKGVTEGSETSVSWDSIFASREGTIERLEARKLTIRRASDGHRSTRTIPMSYQLFVREGDAVGLNQVIAGLIEPLAAEELNCPGHLPSGYIFELLRSRERTQRFTGVKLARLRKDTQYRRLVRELSNDPEEDAYIRLEGLSYLTAVCGVPAHDLFRTYLQIGDPQLQLESVIALGEAANPTALGLLSEILDDPQEPYFIRSAAAWCLCRAGSEGSARRLVKAFADIDHNIREEALDGIVSIGGPAIRWLMKGLRESNPDIAAGCAEALRQQYRTLPEGVIRSISTETTKSDGSPSWAAWLLGQLPREQVMNTIANIQDSAPALHYALSLLWAFTESWIARRWELHCDADLSNERDVAREV